MKYWLFDGKDAQGPYDPEELKRLPGFSADSVICPDGAMSADQWKPAQFYLIRPPAAKEGGAMGGGAPQPGAAKGGPRMGRIADAESEVARVETASPAVQRSLPSRAPSLSPQALASIAAVLLATMGGAYFLRKKPQPVQAPQAAAAPEPARPVIDEAMQREAVDLVRTFPLQSEAPAQPADAADVLEPSRWKAPRTLTENLERRGLQALAVYTAADAQKRGKTMTQAKRELAGERAVWADRASRWLKRNVSLRWEAEPLSGSKWKVTAARSERRGAPEELMAWEADLLRRTLKPLDLEAWLAVDAKAAGRWADRHAPLGELPPLGAVAQAAPAYEIARPRARRGPRPQKPGALAKSGPSGPADDIGDEDLGGLDEPAEKPAPVEKPAPAPKSRPAEEPPPSAEAKPAPSGGGPAPPVSPQKAPPPPAAAESGKSKNAMEMSVEELNKYLNRGADEDKRFQ